MSSQLPPKSKLWLLYHFADTGIFFCVYFVIFMRSNVTYPTRQVSRVSCLAQDGFAALGTQCDPSEGPPLLTLNNFE